jgi:hypothetical protein
MERIKFYAIIALAGSLAVACAGPEEELVDRFLAATQRGDNQLVAAISMVSFPEDVVSWEIVEVVDLPTETYRVPVLRQKVEDAERMRDEQYEDFGEFRQEHFEDLRRIQNRIQDDPGYRFSGRLGELQEEWERQRQERTEVVNSLHEAQMELEHEIRQVAKSLQRESSPEYLTGQTRKKAVIVRVRTPGAEKTYRIILSRYELKNQFGAVVPSRFIISDLTEEGP